MKFYSTFRNCLKIAQRLVGLAFFLGTHFLFAQPVAQNLLRRDSTLRFEENKGQIADSKGIVQSDILFTMKADGLNLFFRRDGISYQWHYNEKVMDGPYQISEATGKPIDDEEQLPPGMKKPDSTILHTYRMDMQWANSDESVEVVAEEPYEDYNNYYLAHCPQGVLGVKNYKKIVYKNLYPNIDAVYYVKDGHLKYDVVVHKDGNVQDVKFRYVGANPKLINGKVRLETPLGFLEEQEPIAFYRSGKKLKLDYELSKDFVSFHSSVNISIDEELIIDPQLLWATYYGGPSSNQGTQTISTTTDINSNVYLAGITDCSTLISFAGHQMSYGGGTGFDAFLVKFNNLGVRLWATYYGGSEADQGRDVSTDSGGNIYLVGLTSSISGIASGGYQNSLAGASDAFLVKFTAAGSRIWATYYGGSVADNGYSVKVDLNDDIVISGYTNSSSGIAFNGYQNTISGLYDYFIVKFNSLGVPQWGTYFGSPTDEYGSDIDVDQSGNIFLTGATQSSSGIAITGGHQLIYGGTGDAILAKFSGSGNLLWSTYYGGSMNDSGTSVSVDTNGDVYVGGITSSTNSISFNGYQNSIGGGQDGFLVKFSGTGVRLWGTYYGGSAQDLLFAIVTKGSQSVYVTGQTYSPDGIAAGGYQNSLIGVYNSPVAKFSSTGNFEWGTYYGGENNSSITISLGLSGNIYFGGYTTASSGIAFGGTQNTYSPPASGFLVAFSDFPPIISGFSPVSGPVGTEVIIDGNSFSDSPGDNTVFFGATKANVIAATNTQLTVEVPVGATYQPITVLTNGLLAYSSKPFVVTFVGGPGIDANSFAAKVDFTSGTSPRLVSIGDLDGDGKADLAVPNYGSNTVSVFRNIGSLSSISFAERVDLISETGPQSISIGDLDGDGKADLAVANNASNIVSVFRNTGSIGNISYAAKIDFTTGTNLNPFSVSIGDLDGDGKADLAVTNKTTNTVSVFRNTGSVGSINFAEKVDFTTGMGPHTVAISDLDGDGKADLAVANSSMGSNTVSVFRNTSSIGSISFAVKVDFATGAAPFSVSIGDLDGDGKADLAVANSDLSSNTVSVFRNTGTVGSISFAVKVDFATGAAPLSVSIGDLDGDGKADLAVANQVNSNVSVFLNTGSVGSISYAAKVDFTNGTQPYSVSIGDLDGDGKTDLATANFTSNTVSVFRNAIGEALAEPTAQPTSLSFSNLLSTSMTLSWSAAMGSPTGYIVIRKTGSSPLDVPGDGTEYSVGEILGSSTVAYVGTSTSFNDTGLNSLTNYYYDVFSYNGSTGTYNYRTIGPLEGNRLTIAAEPTIQASNLLVSFPTVSSLKFDYIIGNGTNRILLCREGSPINELPLDGTSYIANAAFGLGSQIGTGNFVVSIGTNPITVTGLIAGTTYYFSIYEFNGSAGTENYNLVEIVGSTVSAPTIPNAPATLNPTLIQNTSFQANWLASVGANDYRLDVSADNFSTYVSGFNNLAVTGTSKVVTGLSMGNSYQYRIRASNISGTSSNSSVGQALTFPSIVVANAATLVTQSGFTASWTAVSGATDYQLDVSDDNFSTFLAGYSSLVVVGTSQAITGLQPGTQYQYRVRATNMSGSGANSNVVSQLLLPPNPILDDPSLVAASSFKASWQPATGAGTYLLEVSKDDFATYISGYGPKEILTGTDEFVTGLTPNTIYKFRVKSQNATGTSNYSTVKAVQTLPITSTLQISVNVSVNVANGVKVGITVTGGAGSPSVTINIRKITGTTFSPVTLSAATNVFEFVVSDADMDELGAEYYFTASDVSTPSPLESSRQHVYRSFDNSNSPPIPFPPGMDGTTSTYQMFSIPYQVSANSISGIFDEFGKYDKTKWRLFHYKNGKYVENEDGLNLIEPGKGYWFNSIQNLEVKPGQLKALDVHQSDPFTMQLSPGWNQIGNPFPFTISWDAVIAANSSQTVNPIWAFNTGVYSKTNGFKPWTGAFLFSDDGAPLIIPVTAKCASCRIHNEGIGSNPDDISWILPLEVNIGNLQSSGGIGMHPEANLTKDKFDEITLPRFVEYLEMKTYHPEFFAPNFSTDVVATADQAEWLFTVSSSSGNGHASLRWDNTSLAGSKSRLALLDLHEGVLVDMNRESSYSFAFAEGRQLKILYGRDGVLKPGVDLLGNAYPNPFKKSTTIPFMLQENNEAIQVQLFDLTGKKVRVIEMRGVEAGIHLIEWDGLNDQGNPVDAGLFLYQLSGDRGRLSLPKRLIKN